MVESMFQRKFKVIPPSTLKVLGFFISVLGIQVNFVVY